jgi:hypothetical protein
MTAANQAKMLSAIFSLRLMCLPNVPRINICYKGEVSAVKGGVGSKLDAPCHDMVEMAVLVFAD